MEAELWQEIRGSPRGGRSIKAIARDLGIARNTVRRALTSDTPPVRRRGHQRVHRGPVRAAILQELAADPT